MVAAGLEVGMVVLMERAEEVVAEVVAKAKAEVPAGARAEALVAGAEVRAVAARGRGAAKVEVVEGRGPVMVAGGMTKGLGSAAGGSRP